MASNDTVKLTFEGVDDVSDVIKKINKNLASTEKQTQKTSKNVDMMGKATKIAGGLIATYLTKQTAEAVIQLANLGAKATLVEKNFQKFASNSGQQVDGMMQKLRAATKGMVDDMTLQQNAMKSMISGIEFDDMIVAMDYVTSYALATGDDVNQKMATVMTGLARGSAQFMDDVGIQVMGAADVVGATIDQMKQKMGQFADAGDETATKIAGLKTAVDNAQQSIGKALAPALDSIVPKLTTIVEKTAELTIKLIEVNKVMFTAYTIDDMRARRSIEYFKTQEKTSALFNVINQQANLLKDNEKEIAEEMALQEKMLKKSGGHENMSVKASQKRLDKLLARNEALKENVKLGKEALNTLVPDASKTPTEVTATGGDDDSEEAKHKAMMERINAGKSALQEARDWSFQAAKYEWDLEKKKTEKLKEEIDERVALYEEQAEIEKQIADTKKEIEALDRLEREEAQQEAMDKSIQMQQQAMQLQQAITNAVFQSRMNDINIEEQRRKESIRNSTLSEKQKAKELEKVDKDVAKSKQDLAMKQWKLDVFSAMAAAGLAVARTAAENPPPPGLPWIILAGAMGAASVAATVAARPKFALGGVVGGNSFSGDQVPVQVNSGEVIATQSQQRRLLDVMEGKTSVGSSAPSNVVTMGDTTVVINGTAEKEDIDNALIEHEERVMELIYNAVDGGRVDTTRTQGLI